MTIGRILPVCLAGIIAFHLAYTFEVCAGLILIYFYGLYELSRLGSGRKAFYVGLAMGMAVYAPQLSFFWTIFGPAAIALWLVLSLWLALFGLVARTCRSRLGDLAAGLLIPFIWMGLEYFRSELYYLRFTWLNGGYVFANRPAWIPLRELGVYGMGFLLMAVVSMVPLLFPRRRIVVYAVALAVLGTLANLPTRAGASAEKGSNSVRVAGVQLEMMSEGQVLLSLDQLIKEYPETQLAVLSEYTFGGPIPDEIRNWCRKNHRYLVVGGQAPTADSYYNTTFVISPSGETVFQQAKCVPIQFFKDGLPAAEQKLWESPWGKIGLCICYDLSYSRVTDQLIRLGAQAIVVPTMDVIDWGTHQHRLHTRIAPTRAAEYGVPIFRLASSGISQLVAADGRVTATAPTPGPEAMLAGTLALGRRGTLPLDRIFAPLAVATTAGLIIYFLVSNFMTPRKLSAKNPKPL